MGKTFADVTMVKFVAAAPIDADASGVTTFQVSVNADATLGKQNFWRSYQKGWREADGTGTWVYGSVVAAEPTKAGVLGMVFNDANANGIKDAGETFTNPGGKVTAILTEKNGGIPPLPMTVNTDGSFASLVGGIPYNLKVGEYVVTINNADATMGFTTTTPGTHSNGTNWNMDIPQANVATNHSSATYEISVTTGSPLSNEYVGVGLKSASTVTYAAGTGLINWASPNPAEYVNYNNTPRNAPTIDASITQTGYNPTTQMWKLDKNVQLTDGTNISAGTTLTRAQLYQVKVVENLVATVSLSPFTYTVAVSVVDNNGGSASTNPTTVNYNASSLVSTTATVGYELDYIKVNGTAVSVASGGTYAINNITANQSVEVKFKPLIYKINYNLDGGSVGTANPVTYTIETAQFTLNNPTKTGYSFAGWTGTGLGTMPPYTTTVMVGPAATGDRDYTAHWSANNNTAYKVEHYWKLANGTYAVHETENKIGTTGAAVTATAKTYDYYTENTSYSGRIPNGNIAGDGTLVLKLYYDKTIFDLTFDSQGADQAMMLDALSLRVPQDAAVTSVSGFPSQPPTKAGHVFRGWQMPDSSWVTSTTRMPPNDLKLTAVWERGTVVTAGKVTIVASGFIMSISDAQAHQAKSSSAQFTELVSRGLAKAWWTESRMDVPIEAVDVYPSSGNGKSIDAITGDYNVTYYAGTGADEASVKVVASVFDSAGNKAGIGGNNFSYNVKGGALSEAMVRSLGKVAVYDQWGNKTSELARVNQDDLAVINSAITAEQTGNVSVRFTNAASDTVAIVITLVKDSDVPGSGGGNGGGSTSYYYSSPAVYTILSPVVETLSTVAQPFTGSTIGDNTTPLQESHGVCWVHIYMVLGIIITAIYTVCVAIRRVRFTNSLRASEDNFLGGPGAPTPYYGSQDFDRPMTQGTGV